VNKAPPPVTKQARPLPGEEYETANPPPPLPADNAVEQVPFGTTEQPVANETMPQAPPVEQSPPPAETPPPPASNGV
jgi:monofunctional biosynthetic peptidoglycan transglycosylase